MATSLDLHGKTWDEAKTEFVDFYNGHVRSGSRARLDIIHGYGSSGVGGVLRDRLRAFLARFSDNLMFQPGEDVDGNPGHTVVVPLKPLPSMDDALAEEIWAYCSEARTLSKITGKFRRHGDPEVKRAIRALTSQGRLRQDANGLYRA